MVAAIVLDPEGHYKYRFSSKVDYVEALTNVIGRIADPPHTAVQVLAQFELFRASKRKFDQPRLVVPILYIFVTLPYHVSSYKLTIRPCIFLLD